MQTRVRTALALLAVAGLAALVPAFVLTRPEPKPFQPWGGPVHAARAWLEAVRIGDGTSACQLLDPMVLERVGGTIGACSLHFAEPRPMQFRIVSVARDGDVYSIGVATTRELGTIQVELEGRRYRVLQTSFSDEMMSA
jgi:hypothetical protein